MKYIQPVLKLLIVTGFWLVSIPGFGQSDDLARTASYVRKFIVVPPAPEAAQLGKYGDIPVSYFTGTPQIGLPLCNLNGRGVSLPLSLNYNASGIKVAEDPSWVGSGWSLNAGGVRTRSVIGNPDLDFNYVSPPASSVKGVDRYTFFEEMNNGYKKPSQINTITILRAIRASLIFHRKVNLFRRGKRV